ncbi:hypothetical protein ACO0QE_004567 [Hanseniaspora vineae]
MSEVEKEVVASSNSEEHKIVPQSQTERADDASTVNESGAIETPTEESADIKDTSEHSEAPIADRDNIVEGEETEKVEIDEGKAEDEEVKEDEVDEDMDDLFGDADDDEDEDLQLDDDEEEVVTKKKRSVMDEEDEEEDDDDEKEETRENYFYRNADDNDEDEQYEIKEADVTLSRHIIPYKTAGPVTGEEDTLIYHVKVPQFLKIDAKPFDPQMFEEEVEERLRDPEYTREDKIDAGLIDENTIRWRYSKDENNNVSKESNAVIVQWEDGTYSLKIGEEYTDILINDIDNCLLVKSHEREELMQSVQGGFINKNMMFVPTSMNSKIHKRLTKAVHNHNAKEQQDSGPKTFIIRKDPDLELKELEKKQDQVLRERRRNQLREKLEKENALYGDQDKAQSPFSFNKRASSGYQDEYGDQLLDEEEDEEEEEDDNDFINDDEVDEDEEEEEADEEEEDDDGDDDARAERLRHVKKHGFSYANDEDDGEPANNASPSKRRKVIVEDDEE